jgi:glycosyltransferase involved in cell wall biosynthesis
MDVLIVSLGSTGGLRAVDEELLGSLRRAGASADVVRAVAPSPVRTLMLTDLRWALAARRALRAELERRRPRAIVYSTTTAALLWPAPGAVRFDAPAAGSRPGRHGLWQRPLERRRLREAPLLLPQSEGALLELPRSLRRVMDPDRALVLPVPVEPSDELDRLDGAAVDPRTPALRAKRSGTPQPVRDIAAITYAANPCKKGLHRVLAAWSAARKPGERLVVAGASADELRQAGLELAVDSAAGVKGVDLRGVDLRGVDLRGVDLKGAGVGGAGVGGEGVGVEDVDFVGVLPREQYRALLRRARVFVCAARREDHGIAQLEALADGCMLVTTPSPGPYVALPVARELDGRLIDEDLGAALRTALDDPTPRYHERALRALAPLRRAEVDRLVAQELLPRLLTQERRPPQ